MGLFFIFFIGRKFNPEVWTRNFTLTANWVNHFRKWLDVSWWTKLVFKVSYDKYEQVYEWAELASVKKMIENIILKNIDERISWLWVSDYSAYVQSMDNTPYIVVEIWGIADLDQAKEIIWKTVELEFRLPNELEPTYADKQARKDLAISIKNEIESNDWDMVSFADARWSENIFYTHWTGVTLWQLPDFYKDSSNRLDIQKWVISNVITDKYDVVDYQDISGNVNTTELYWYTFYRINDVVELDRNNTTSNDIVDVAEQLWYSYDTTIEKWDVDTINTYDYIDWNLVYNLWPVAEKEEAYNVKIVQVSQTNTLGGDDQDFEDLTAQKNEIIKDIEQNIKNSDSFENWELVANDWVWKEQIKEIIPDFDLLNIDWVKTYTQLATTYVVYLQDIKTKDETLVSELVVEDVNKDKFEDVLSSKILYDMEEVFVQDRETWQTAKSNNGKILNGAYFKYANVSQSQMWLPVVAIQFDDKGTQIFCDITSDNIWKQMAIFVWWENLTSPVIRSSICGGTAQIDGEFTNESAKELVDALNNWALPAPLILMQEEKISPTLGANALTWALIAAVIGMLAIFVFVFVVYWWRNAVVTLSVLLWFMIVLWFFMKLVDYALSLSWIAAVILSIWMAVDANILIYERTNEERERWKTIDSAIETAYDRSRPAIRDGNISTWLIALLLFMLGSNMFKWFGTMLIVTVLLTLLFNVPLTKMLLKWFSKK